MKRDISCLNDVKTLLFCFEEEENIFTKLEKYIWEPTKVCVAVSGGSDSMFCSVLLYKFFINRKYSLDHIFFVYCNHKTRETTYIDQKFVEKFFWNRVSVFEYTWKNFTEEKMRIWRFKQYQKMLDKNKIDYLILGHNLSDRVESTFLNLLRGSWLSWFLSMDFCEKHHLLEWVNILRPILNISKTKITDLCNQNWVPYQIDPTNKDSSYSKRNKLRNNILPNLFDLGHWVDSFEKSMCNIYEEFENIKNWDKKDFELIGIKKSSHRNAEWAYELKTDKSSINSSLLIAVMDELWMKYNITKNFLKELNIFLLNKNSGYKFFGGVTIFIAHSRIYFIKAEREFWKKTPLEVQEKFENLAKWSIVRYSKAGDYYKWKTWNKWCLNEKIPVFWRKFIPLVILDWEIINFILNK